MRSPVSLPHGKGNVRESELSPLFPPDTPCRVSEHHISHARENTTYDIGIRIESNRSAARQIDFAVDIGAARVAHSIDWHRRCERMKTCE